MSYSSTALTGFAEPDQALGYRIPPPEIATIVDAPVQPSLSFSPDRKKVLKPLIALQQRLLSLDVSSISFQIKGWFEPGLTCKPEPFYYFKSLLGIRRSSAYLNA